MLQGLTSHHRLILLTLALATICVLAAYAFSTPAAIIVGVLLIALLIIFRPLLLPPGWGATKVRMYTLGIGFAIASYGVWADLFNAAVSIAARDSRVMAFAPWLLEVQIHSEPSTAMLLFVFGLACVVNYRLSDTTSASVQADTTEQQFKSEPFISELAALRSALKNELQSADVQTNWNWHFYMPPETEVTTAGNVAARSRRSVDDLLASLLRDDYCAALLLGDPGSGKSVALRKLAHQQLKRGLRVPIYINLREWRASADPTVRWSESNPPSVAQLEHFVVNSIKSRGDSFIAAFVDKHFSELWHRGYLYFIFDSFDEIPELLDAGEENWLINALSRTISHFLKAHPRAQGVLASRMFRQPTQEFTAEKILNIRPLADELVCRGLSRFQRFTPELRSTLFRKRSDLVSIARNPFMLSLLGAWIEAHGTLPKTQAELYDDNVRNRIAKLDWCLRKHQLTEMDVLAGARDIALFVFQSHEYGLEAPAQVLEQQSVTPHVNAIIEILRLAHIGRVTGGDVKSFAFVHRRFLEYFVAKSLMANPTLVPRDHIPKDSRGRESLVLYAQVCDLREAEDIAIFCWEQIALYYDYEGTHPARIHCLRFLIDAFRSRLEAIRHFRKLLGVFVLEHSKHGSSLLLSKIALEAVGMLYPTAASTALLNALHCRDPWLQETAFRASRQMHRVSRVMQCALTEYIVNMPFRQFWRMRRSLLFSLSLSEALAPTRSVARWRAYGTVALFMAVSISIATTAFVEVDGLTVGCGFIIFAFLRHETVLRAFTTAIALGSKPGLKVLAPAALVGAAIWFGPWPREPVLLVITSAATLVSVFLATFLNTYWAHRRFVKRRPVKSPSPKQTEPQSVLAVLLVLFGVSLLILIVLACPVVAVFALTAWLTEHPIYWTAGITIAVLASFGLCELVQCHRERRHVDALRFGETISRDEIVAKLQSLEYESTQLRYIRKLAAQRIVATGHWPPFFEVSLGLGQCVSELAKLDERWLNLDR